MSHFDSVLVANRGEIACRVIRSANALGYRTVAVYSEADADAPHTRLADQSVCIGPAAVSQSYLRIDNILKAARDSGAQAIHPGYGFLSENADFARACEDAGLTFIGPGPEAIDLMGNKAESKRRMLAAGVPCVPGYQGVQDDQALLDHARDIGLPIMVKAAAGGGGRGMRLVDNWEELRGAIGLARSEAENAFGNGELILEKAILRPRHVELQVFADNQGNCVYLGERDCSVQRRHQKVVEEAPCPVMTEQLRAAMGDAAVAAAKSINYRGAGTVEFLLDEQGSFYFLEMNTRLQVEHPVTEMITGLDLVALQLQVAQGEPLGFAQQDVQLNGHAIEVRLYTEDPAQDFLPMAGRVDCWRPATGPGVRIDDGICSGQEISPFYDPMIAKVIAHGPDREAARRRLIGALKGSLLFGVTSNKGFLLSCLQKQTFIDGQATTAFIAEEFAEADLAADTPTLQDAAMAAVLDLELTHRKYAQQAVTITSELQHWSSDSSLASRKIYVFEEVQYDLAVTCNAGQFQVSDADGQSVMLSLVSLESDQVGFRIEDRGEDQRDDRVESRAMKAGYLRPEQGRVYLSIEGRDALFIDQIMQGGTQEEGTSGGQVLAPMHGLLLQLKVAEGDQVTRGQPLAIMEAMKMQHEIQAGADGQIKQILATRGTQVAADQLLIEIELADSADS